MENYVDLLGRLCFDFPVFLNLILVWLQSCGFVENVSIIDLEIYRYLKPPKMNNSLIFEYVW